MRAWLSSGNGGHPSLSRVRVARARFLLVCATVVAAWTGAPREAAAGWRSVGKMTPARSEVGGVTFSGSDGILSLTALTPEVVRVRFAPAPAFGRDHSYAVCSPSLDHPAARVSSTSFESTLVTSALRVVAHHDPFRLEVLTASGESLDADDRQRGIAVAGSEVRAWKRLRDDEHVYGLGEKNGRLDKRGRQLGGYSYAMWNSDTYAYDADTDPIYVSVPFFMVVRNGTAHGIFLDNTHRSSFDIGHQLDGLLSFGAAAGELNYYFIYGPTPRQVIERYTALTGRTPLPPRWALGYHQCRYSYYPAAKVRWIADTLRVRRIPADTIWFDIHYLDSYKPFTWDRERFPDPAGLIRDLRAQGLRAVTIVDPHPKKEVGYAPYDTGLAGDHFVKNPDGSVYEAPVWPAKAERNPGPSVFPDFSKPGAREWWGGLYRDLLDQGVAGIWNDMNEPAVFVPPTGTMPLDVRHDNEGQPSDHREIHNVYGMLMSRSTFEGLLRLRPDARPFVLTRASFAGGQRYAAVWPGDNQSDWSHLRGSIPTLLGLGLSGFSFVGSDIGGFAEAPSAELVTRWMQLGVFYPFMRCHTSDGTPDQEPWSYGLRHEAVNRRAIELRYELLPHLYNVMHESATTGIPAMRPMFLEYPEDEATLSLDDQFLFGADLLVAPVLREGADRRSVYLPRGEWYDYWTGRSQGTAEAGRTVSAPVTLDSLPLFVRAGAFVFRQPVVQHTGQMPGQPLEVLIYPAARSSAALYEDDGATLGYERGEFASRELSQERTADGCTIRIGAVTGSYRPTDRTLKLRILAPGPVDRVVLEPPSGPRGSKRPPQDLAFTFTEDGALCVSLTDRWDPFTVRIVARRPSETAARHPRR
jgi:alpha-glucosidase